MSVPLLPGQAGGEMLRRLETVLTSVAAGRTLGLAYSGGLDSRFLAFAARNMGFEPVLLHVFGPHVPAEETAWARRWALWARLPYEEIFLDPLDLPLVASGDRRRCYACKQAVFSRLKEHGPQPLCDGTNASDTAEYRPGLQALRDLGVFSPLALAGLKKSAIHELAASMGMERPRQKPCPCLLTRLPYGHPPERALLAALDDGEQAARHFLAGMGLAEAGFRLRLVAPERLELHMDAADHRLLSPERRKELVAHMRRLAPHLPPFSLLPQDRLSGFFDSH